MSSCHSAEGQGVLVQQGSGQRQGQLGYGLCQLCAREGGAGGV